MKTGLLKQYVFLMLLSVLLFVVFIIFENNKLTYSIQVNNKQELSAQTQQLIQSLDAPLKLDVYSNQDSLLTKKIKKFFQAYVRISDKLTIEFIDPIENPTAVRQNAITLQGEMTITDSSGKQVHITELSESAISNAIIRLNNASDEWIVFAQGYGMTQIDNESSRGLSSVLLHLKKLGFHSARMPLNPALVLPENVKLIVLPAPTDSLSNELLNWLQVQLDGGISILWLHDVGIDTQMGLELLTDVLPGDKKSINDDKYVGLTVDFPQHMMTENFNQPLYLAEAREIMPQSPHQQKIVLQAQDKTPLAVSKELDKARILVVGDSDFISNQYINFAANKSFVVRMIDWLMFHDNRINIAVKVNSNTQLLLSQTELMLLSLVFLILLPLLFLIIAVKQWRAGRG